MTWNTLNRILETGKSNSFLVGWLQRITSVQCLTHACVSGFCSLEILSGSSCCTARDTTQSDGVTVRNRRESDGDRGEGLLRGMVGLAASADGKHYGVTSVHTFTRINFQQPLSSYIWFVGKCKGVYIFSYTNPQVKPISRCRSWSANMYQTHSHFWKNKARKQSVSPKLC